MIMMVHCSTSILIASWTGLTSRVVFFQSARGPAAGAPQQAGAQESLTTGRLGHGVTPLLVTVQNFLLEHHYQGQ